MKKIITTVIFAVFIFAGPLMSQKQFYFGLGGGGLSSAIVNQNNYGFDDLDFGFTIGGAGNINVGFDFSKNIGLKLEIGFAKLGQKYSGTAMLMDDTVDSKYTRNIKLNYLQIPILFKFRTSGETVKFYAMAGPQFNLLLSASQEYLKNEVTWDDEIPGNGAMPTTIGQSDITDRYNSLDVMVRIDFGVDIILTKNLFLNAGITTAYGLMDINATYWQQSFNPKNTTYTYSPSHNVYGGINVGINYTLPVGSK